MGELAVMSRTDPLLFPLLDKIMIARTYLDDTLENVHANELSKKVNYILELKNEDPLHLNQMDLYNVREALQNRLRYSDLITNPDHVDFRNTIDRLVHNNWNRTIERLLGIPDVPVELEDLNRENDFGGKRTRRNRRRSRKYKK